ncbi:MAG: hypothetical protein HY746_10700 [Elusimicrobia bacterium]|nr:hypothetical protein [Elusimicrobiota bacterium]
MINILVACAVIVTIAFVIFVIQAFATLKQVQHTAKAVEHLALNADSHIEAFDKTIDSVKTFSMGVSSGWLKLIQFVAGIISKKKPDSL